MNVAEWIIVCILSVTLFIFLILGIIFFVKMIKLTKQAKIVVEKGQDVVDRAGDVVENVKRRFTVGALVKSFISRYNGAKSNKRSKKGY